MAERITMSLYNAFPASLMHSLFRYEPESGRIYWKASGKGRHASRNGEAGFFKNARKYKIVYFQKKQISFHRLAWCLHYGDWPDQILDHINGDPSDNRIANLRLASFRMNSENQRRARCDSKTGLLGVSRHRDRFRAYIRSQGVRHSLGLFDTAELAHEAYVAAKRALHEGCSI